MGLITTKDAADRLGVTLQRVHALITSGRLPARKMGRDYIIKESALKLVEDRKPGRPPNLEKQKAIIKAGKKKASSK